MLRCVTRFDGGVWQALRFLHLRRIVHCDLKPDNILIARDACGRLRLKLADWGYAQVVPPPAPPPFLPPY